MRKNKGIIITAFFILAVVAVAEGSHLVKNYVKNQNRESKLPEAATESSAESSSGSFTKSISEPTSETAVEPVTELASKPGMEPVTELASEPVTEQTAEQDAEAAADLSELSEISNHDFYISEIPDEIFEKMQGKSFKQDCTVPREDLRYLHVLHKGFDGQTKEGELVVNKAIADDVLAIFEELYQADYPIEKVRLVDEYDADDEASMRDNNSSAFNFRFISHTTKVSKHGLGMAVDINPLYNPYVKAVKGETSVEPAVAAAYVDRSGDLPYKIDHDDLCYKLFTKYGFTWGGDWEHSKDYQHFERGE